MGPCARTLLNPRSQEKHLPSSMFTLTGFAFQREMPPQWDALLASLLLGKGSDFQVTRADISVVSVAFLNQQSIPWGRKLMRTKPIPDSAVCNPSCISSFFHYIYGRICKIFKDISGFSSFELLCQKSSRQNVTRYYTQTDHILNYSKGSYAFLLLFYYENT